VKGKRNIPVGKKKGRLCVTVKPQQKRRASMLKERRGKQAKCMSAFHNMGKTEYDFTKRKSACKPSEQKKRGPRRRKTCKGGIWRYSQRGGGAAGPGGEKRTNKKKGKPVYLQKRKARAKKETTVKGTGKVFARRKRKKGEKGGEVTDRERRKRLRIGCKFMGGKKDP